MIGSVNSYLNLISNLSARWIANTAFAFTGDEPNASLATCDLNCQWQQFMSAEIGNQTFGLFGLVEYG